MTEREKPYSVVELDDGGVFTVASKWIDPTIPVCYYPKTIKGQNPKRMVLACAELPASITDDKWHSYDRFVVLHAYEKFMVAEKATAMACKGKEIFSNVETDMDKPRERRPTRRFSPDDSDSSPHSLSEDEERSQKSGKEPSHSVRMLKKKKKKSIKVFNRIRNPLSDSDEEANLDCPLAFNHISSTPSDMDELERLVALKKQEVELQKKANHKNKKPTTTVLRSKSPKPDNSCVRDLFNAKSTPIRKDGSSPFKVHNISVAPSQSVSGHSVLVPHNDRTEGLSARSPGLMASSDHSDPSSNRSNATSSVSSNAGNITSRYIKGYKGSQVFSFNKAHSFEQAAPALEQVLSALLNSNHETSSKVDFMGMNIESLVAKICPEELVHRPCGMPKLKLESCEDLEKFNLFLANRPNRKSAVEFFSAKIRSSKNVGQAARILLSSIFTNSLARLVSWQGTAGLKCAFQETNLCTVVESAILKKFPDDDLAQAHRAIKRWLNTSFQRPAEISSNNSNNSQEDVDRLSE